MARKIILAALFIISALPFQSCNPKDDPARDTIVAILKEGNSDYWGQIAYSIQSECEAYGYKAVIKTTASEYDIAGQISAAEYLSANKDHIKGVIFSPIYPEGSGNPAEDIINEAVSESGAPVVFLDSKAGEHSPLAYCAKSYVGVNIPQTAKSFAGLVPETEASKMLCILYGTTATMERYRIFKQEKGIENDDNAIIVTESTPLTAPILNARLSSMPKGSTVVLFNGDFYDKILVMGNYVENFSDKQVIAFDIYRSLLKSMKDNGQVAAVQAQNTFEMGRKAVDCILATKVSPEVLIPTIKITPDNIGSVDVNPFAEYFNL